MLVGLHAHSTLSDGRLAPDEVARAARRAGLDVLFLTDHDTAGAPAPSPPRWVDGLLLVPSEEVGTDAGHVLALGMRPSPFRVAPEPEEAVADIHARGGLAIVAHPTNPRLPWRGTYEGFDGVEILNGDTSWRSASTAAKLRAIVIYPLNPRGALLALARWPSAELGHWDRLNRIHPVLGLVGADAHGGVGRGWVRLPWPSYEATLGLVTNHVLLDQPLAAEATLAAAQVLAALRSRHSFIAADALAPARGFRFESAPSGVASRIPQVAGASQTLLVDGVEVAASSASELSWPTSGRGAYRLEVRLDHPGLRGGSGVPWILSNANVLGAAAEPTAPAPMPATPSERALLWPGAADVHVELDAADRCERLAGSDPVVFHFRLAAQGSGGFCALADRSPRDLSRFQGLVIYLRADRPCRIELQLREGGGAEARWWRRTIAAGEASRAVVVPFGALRDVAGDGGAPPRLNALAGVYFIADPLTARGGAEAVVSIERLAAY